MAISCAFMAVNYDGDGWDFKHVDLVPAKKKYKCTECGKDILPGDVYESFRGKADGQWHSGRTCPVCLNIRNVLFCDGWQYEGLYEDLDNHIFEVETA